MDPSHVGMGPCENILVLLKRALELYVKWSSFSEIEWLLGDLLPGDPYSLDAVIAIGWTDSFSWGEVRDQCWV